MKQNLSILQLIDSLAPGGAEMMAVNIANGLGEDNVKSHLCTTRKEGDLKLKIASNVGYLFLNKKSVLDFKAIRLLYKYLKQHHIHIIHAHSSSYFMGFIMKLLNPKLQLIWHNHYGNSLNLSWGNKIPLFLISKSFDSIISVNKKLNDWAITNLKIIKSYYLANFGVLDNRSDTITRLKGSDGKRIVCLANLRKEKDHLNLLKAFSIVNEKHNDWTLHLVGMDFSDVYSAEIKEYIRVQGIENHVFLYGSCSDTAHVLEQTTIGVLSSYFEGLPVALLEYGLMKLPVIVTNVGECGKVVTNDFNGKVVPKENGLVLAAGLLELIANKNKRKEFGSAFYNTIIENYSKKSYIKKLIAIYESF